ncbi:thermonuclease family protein [Priestia megaterium]
MQEQLYTYKAKVLEVKDGDTYTVTVDVGFRINHEMELRMFTIDTPETKHYPGRYIYDEEIQLGKEIGEWVRKRIEGKEVILKTHLDDTDKYGRLLADVYYEVDGELVHLNQKC